MRRRNPASRGERGFCGNRTDVLSASQFSVERRGHAGPWRTASCSSGLERNVQKLGGGLSVFEAFGDYAEGESLHARDGFVTVGAIAHDPGQCRYFGQPPAIVLALKFDRKGHACTVASGPAVYQPLGAGAPNSSNSVAAARGSSGNVDGLPWRSEQAKERGMPH